MKYDDLIKNNEIKEIFNLIDNNNSTEIYHGLQHALNVIDNINKLSTLLNIDLKTQEQLKIAAYLHDIGHLYGKDNHQLKSKEYAEKCLKNKLDKNTLSKILSAIENHHQKEKINELPLFDHILLFADKMDFSNKRINKKYLNTHKEEYLLQNNILSIDFDIKDNIFLIIIKTNNLDINEFKKWNFYPKIIKRIEEFSNKLNMNYEINLI